MTRELAATVILPTTGDRWELVRYSLDCIKKQTVEDIEILIIGDGVAERSRNYFAECTEGDSRIRFFDYPKHESRGEPHRHELLTNEARGSIIAYCCDRDLWFPHHLETLREALAYNDFVHTLPLRVSRSGQITLTMFVDLSEESHRRSLAREWSEELGIPLSLVAHSLEAYRRLPEGWATTPRGRLTDIHMWQKWLRQSSVRAATIPKPTVLYFNRGRNSGWPIDCRRDELAEWHARVQQPAGYLKCLEESYRVVYKQRVTLFHESRWGPVRLLVRLRDRWRRITSRKAAR